MCAYQSRERGPDGRVVACRYGHPYAEGSYYTAPSTGSRVCRICQRERAAKKRGSEESKTVDQIFFESIRYEGDCWLWRQLSADRYGHFMGELAHRWSYQRFVADLGNLSVDHLCENKACVRPDHLEAVTNAENTQRYYRRRAAEKLDSGSPSI